MRKFFLALVALLLSTQLSVAATCFWVGGTGSWTTSNAASWSSSSGGAGSTCGAAGGIPGGGADTATFNASSGGGTVTLNYGGTITVQSIVLGAFTGTFDNSVNNNNINLTGAGFNNNGSGVRTVNLGTATYTLSSTATDLWDFNTVTNLTYNGTSANIVYTATNGYIGFRSGNVAHGNVTFPALSALGRIVLTGTFTVTSLTLGAPSTVQWSNVTITNAVNWAGTASSSMLFISSALASAASINTATGSVGSWITLRDIQDNSSHLVISNCLNPGGSLPGITCNAPSAGGGGCIFGGWLFYGDITGRGHDNDNWPAFLDKAG